LKFTRDILALGGIFTILATGYGLYDSWRKTLDDRERARITERRTQEAERRVQFADAVKKLESNNAISKMIAVSALGGYLTKEDRPFHRQILSTFASVVSTEQDIQTQAAILDLVTAQDLPAIDAKDWSYFQNMLVSQSRAIVARGHLYTRRQFGLGKVKPSEDEVAARHVGNMIAVNIRSKVVPEFTAYAGIYCEACNLRYTKFPEGADFTGAILDRADFRGATIEGAVFDNAEMEGTTFAQAYLRNASFKTVPLERLMEGVGATADDVTHIELSTPYVQHTLRLLDSQKSITMTMPNFSCANLQGARFNNHSMFGFRGHGARKVAAGDNLQDGWRSTLSEQEKRKVMEGGSVEISHPLTANPPSFFRADLSGAHLEEIRAFSVWATSDATPYPYFASSNRIYQSDLVLWEGTIMKNFLLPPPPDPNAVPRPVNSVDFSGNDREALKDQMQIAFLGVDLSTVNLPEGFTEVVNDGIKTKIDQDTFERKYPKSKDWDWSCVTTTWPLQ
jgi:hypothetical protein